MITEAITRKKSAGGRIDFYTAQFHAPVATLTPAPGGWVLSVYREIVACFPHYSEANAISATLRKLRTPNG
jgi:hypothetical protein